MPIDTKYKAKFVHKKYYHVYNRTNNKEQLFKEAYDYLDFKYKSKTFLNSYLTVVAFCLLGNHFHFLVKIKSSNSIRNNIKKEPGLGLTKNQLKYLSITDEISLNELIIDQFRKLFISHSMKINNKYSRKGNLFSHGFKRVQVNESTYLKKLILYIHWNPVKHGIEVDIENYEWSSYYEMVKGEKILHNKKALIRIFGGKNKFLKHHNQESEYKLISDLMLEEKAT